MLLSSHHPLDYDVVILSLSFEFLPLSFFLSFSFLVEAAFLLSFFNGLLEKASASFPEG